MKKKQLLVPGILAVIIALLFAAPACKKDDGKNLVTHFSVTYQDGYAYDYGWVVLHNPDGTEVIDYKKIEGDGVADFGDINGGIVSVTMIRVDTINYSNGDNRTYIYISSDYASPCGNWIFRGNNTSDESLGTADITMTYPNDNYNEYFIHTTSTGTYSDGVPLGGINKQLNVYRLDDGNKYSMYGAVLRDNGGYCNWLLDQNYQLYQANYYNLELSKALNKVNFTTSKPFSNYWIDAYWNERESNLELFGKSYSYNFTPNWETNHSAFLPSNMPVSHLMFYGSYYGDNHNYYYSKFYDMPQGLPDNIEIPDKTITAAYNQSTDEITNIQLNGTADQINGRWFYYEYSGTTRFYISWNVYANWDYQSIKRPVLPQEILDDIGYEINYLECSDIGFSDYNTTASHADIINRFFVNEVPASQRYDEYFSYYYYFDQYKGQEINQREHEVFDTQRKIFRH